MTRQDEQLDEHWANVLRENILAMIYIEGYNRCWSMVCQVEVKNFGVSCLNLNFDLSNPKTKILDSWTKNIGSLPNFFF